MFDSYVWTEELLLIKQRLCFC